MSVVAFSMLLKKSSYESYWNESKPLCVTIQMKATKQCSKLFIFISK